MRSAARAAIVVGLLLAALVATAAAQETSSPRAAVSPGSVAAGEAVVVTVSGFQARNVTLSVCGNAAARGSVDCNQAGSEGIALRDGAATRGLVVQPPPVPCPCVVRAASRTQDEVAVAVLDIVGHPVGEVVTSGSSTLVDVAVAATRPAAPAWEALRTSLGGPATYEVRVTVRNRSGLSLDQVAVDASATRAGDQVAGVDLPAIGPLAPGASWEGTAELVVPAPTLGEVTFHARATGAGRTVTARDAAHPIPWLLLVLTSVLVVDVGLLAWHKLARRRARPRHATDEVRPRRRVRLVGRPAREA